MEDDIEVGEAADEAGIVNKPSNRGLNFLNDVTLQVTVEFGRTESNVGGVVKLTPGSVLELDRQADEPVTIRVNNNLVARGEIVVVNDKYGVRVTEIIDPVGIEGLNADEE